MLSSASKSQKITFILMKCTKTVATRAAPFGLQICTKSFVGWGFAPDPTRELIALPRPLSWFRGWDPLGGRGRGREGNGGRDRWDWDPSTRDGKGGEGNGGKDGGERVGKGRGRKEREKK